MFNEIKVEEDSIKRVEHLKNIAIKLLPNSGMGSKVDRSCDTFLHQFNGKSHKFKFLGMKVLLFLFVSYYMYYNGVEVWYHKMENHKQYRIMSVTYHKEIKQCVV